MSRLDHGRVEIPLADETLEIQPTPDAMRKINRRFGDLRAAAQRVEALDFDALVFILATATRRKDLEQAIFETGVVNLVVPTALYLAALMNPSGREPDESDEEKKA